MPSPLIVAGFFLPDLKLDLDECCACKILLTTRDDTHSTHGGTFKSQSSVVKAALIIELFNTSTTLFNHLLLNVAATLLFEGGLLIVVCFLWWRCSLFHSLLTLQTRCKNQVIIIRPVCLSDAGEYRAVAISVSMVTTIVCHQHAVSFKSGPFTVITLVVPADWVAKLAKKAKKVFPMAQVVDERCLIMAVK
ncbi:hypothetical protein [Alteromonas ponticola]|uniref:Uncharacterized protein n=1 Tax=Alteromonas ponticola TaxID=2720613 RepID=A0ABX1QY69_9ALTE|nr:hypothetical protein [Alteromonas ponticola]NMH58794.1 hypothetical protein [Alteromonas ponticola]